MDQLRGTLFQLWHQDASWPLASERVREHSIRHQISALNMGFVERLRNISLLDELLSIVLAGKKCMVSFGQRGWSKI
ncbi:hypothetical protein [Pseudomonas sp. F01002]|uniref:hypothetical protein n=1 Tax=Pseudomonas sp. F01002 TaxID=2555724 RepID=UPI00106A24D7|nr:hypothetical protein [Pseudomonas sp. F01002]TFB37412.1 hypothetical protein E3W21_22095 [Pseudomonas sp. F01002]